MRTSTVPPKTKKPDVSHVSDTLEKERVELEREKIRLARDMLKTLGLLDSQTQLQAVVPAAPPEGPVEKKRKALPRTPEQKARRWRESPASASAEREVYVPEGDYEKTTAMHAEILQLLERHKVLPLPRMVELMPGRTKGSVDVQLGKLCQRGQLVIGYTKIKGHHTKLAAVSHQAIADWEAKRTGGNRA